MNTESHHRNEESAYAVLASKLQQSTALTYVESLQRPRTDEYVVMPNGVVEFIR